MRDGRTSCSETIAPFLGKRGNTFPGPSCLGSPSWTTQAKISNYLEMFHARHRCPDRTPKQDGPGMSYYVMIQQKTPYLRFRPSNNLLLGSHPPQSAGEVDQVLAAKRHADELQAERIRGADVSRCRRSGGWDRWDREDRGWGGSCGHWTCWCEVLLGNCCCFA